MEDRSGSEATSLVGDLTAVRGTVAVRLPIAAALTRLQEGRGFSEIEHYCRSQWLASVWRKAD